MINSETFNQVKSENRLLLETIRGSHLFGLQTEKSDIDTYGVFIGNVDWYLGMDLDKKFSLKDEKGDTSWAEIGKYINELSRSNPDAITSLFTPEDKILYKHEIMKPLFELRETLLTKECFKPFASYAIEQIKKAKGLNKAMNIDPKTVNRRKSILEFCYVGVGCGTWTLEKYLKENHLDISTCGITKLPNTIETYALYSDPKGEFNFRGIIKDEESTQLRVSSIPLEIAKSPNCYFQFNHLAFSQHCKDYWRYHDWVKNRNTDRYELNKNYSFDSKNMSHCVRILTMAKEIAEGKGLLLDRTNIDRDWLLSIKNHGVNYEELMRYVESLEKEMLIAFDTSNLPEKPEVTKLNKLLINIRHEFYNK